MRKSFLIPILCLAAAVLFRAAPAQVYGQFEDAGKGAGLQFENPDNIATITNGIKLLRLYVLNEGKITNKILSGEDLADSDSLVIEGSVCGVVVFCENDMKVSVDGRKMNRIRRNLDGTFSLRHFGRMKLDDLVPAATNRMYIETVLNEEVPGFRNTKFLPGGFSYFPEVIGHPVSQEEMFSISFESGGGTFRLPVSQDGCEPVRTLNPDSAEKEHLNFWYIGNNREALEEIPDLEQRLEAIGEGVRLVESEFGSDLVQDIMIIALRDIQNAVTCEGKNLIWFYMDTFRTEPVEELKSIAAHESLHIYVDKNRLSKNVAARKLFNQLKGYEGISYRKPSGAGSDASPSSGISGMSRINPLFAFINEKNFMPGMKGGHSQDNIDEFCVSLLHTVLSVENLEKNLAKPLVLSPEMPGHVLERSEKDQLMDAYVLSLQTLIEAMALVGEAPPLVKKGFLHALNVRNRLLD